MTKLKKFNLEWGIQKKIKILRKGIHIISSLYVQNVANIKIISRDGTFFAKDSYRERIRKLDLTYFDNILIKMIITD